MTSRSWLLDKHFLNFSACQPGRFGKNCLEQCGECKDELYCPFTNGVCQHGCERGYRDPACQQGPSCSFYFFHME